VDSNLIFKKSNRVKCQLSLQFKIGETFNQKYLT